MCATGLYITEAAQLKVRFEWYTLIRVARTRNVCTLVKTRDLSLNVYGFYITTTTITQYRKQLVHILWCTRG